MNVICYGDSNTFGYDPRFYFGGRYPADCRWVDILAEKTGWTIQNAGRNGREIPHLGFYVPEDTDLLIIMLGTNDLLQGADADTVAKRMENFLMGLDREMNSVLLVAPPPLQRGEWVFDQSLIDSSHRLSHHYQALSVALGTRFVDAGAWNVALCFDGVHFTEDGHKAFSEGLFQFLQTEQERTV